MKNAMQPHRVFACLAALPLLLGAGCASDGDTADPTSPSASVATGSCPGGSLDPGEYEVLSAVAKAAFLEGAQAMVVMNRSGGADGELISSQSDLGAPPDAVADFAGKNKDAACVEAQFDVGVPTTVIGESDADAFFKDDPVSGWPKFYQAHPGAQGIMKVTRPGFGAGGTQAVVFVSNAKQSLNAEGVVFVLQKQGGTWAVTTKRLIWIS